MTTVQEDLRYLKIALNNLEAYLLSPVLQWTLEKQAFGNQPSTPLTIENLLLVRQQLSKRAMTTASASEFEKLELSFQDLLKRWRANFGKKASQGFQHRLNLWTQYIAELHSDLHAHADRYAYEVRLRVMLTLLSPYIDKASPRNLSQLDTCDQKLHTVFSPGEFVWPVELQLSFPAIPFWYLYGSPRRHMTIS